MPSSPKCSSGILKRRLELYDKLPPVCALCQSNGRKLVLYHPIQDVHLVLDHQDRFNEHKDGIVRMCQSCLMSRSRTPTPFDLYPKLPCLGYTPKRNGRNNYCVCDNCRKNTNARQRAFDRNKDQVRTYKGEYTRAKGVCGAPSNYRYCKCTLCHQAHLKRNREARHKRESKNKNILDIPAPKES